MSDALPAMWDGIVVGAGVTGSTLACLLARAGWRVLLLDRAAFPREKVCGCCLSPAAVTLLGRLGLSGALAGTAARPLRCIEMYLAGWHVSLPHGGVAVSRAALDGALAAAASAEGAIFLDQTAVSLGPVSDNLREVEIQRHGVREVVRARMVFACDGLGGRLLAGEPEMAWTVARHSRMGVHALLPPDSMDIPSDAIVMRAGRCGYVGLVRLEDGRIDLAAALDPTMCRAMGGPLALVRHILRQCGEPTPLGDVAMHGTPLLTRYRRVLGCDRVLAVGDACGYVEPFTGEGMKWGIASAAAVAGLMRVGQAAWLTGDAEAQRPAQTAMSGLAGDPWTEDLPQRWRRLHDDMLAGPMRLCRLLTLAIRYPQALALGLGAIRVLPAVARRLTDAVNAPVAIPSVAVLQ